MLINLIQLSKMIQLEGFLPDQLAYTMGPLSSVGMFNSILG